jgi:hypothetical protein
MGPNVDTEHGHVVAVGRSGVDGVDDAAALQQLDRGALTSRKKGFRSTPLVPKQFGPRLI